VALFQKTVLKEFVKAQNQVLIQEAFDKFQAHFGNPAVQQNILQAKEEQYQEGFLKDLFVNVLGYSLYPQPNYNLITEQKNETDSKKADAAILLEGKMVGVIEMKSTKTFDLRSMEAQAFQYKNAHAGCRYVITSNFRKLRFYLDYFIDYEEFDLFNMDLERFKVLYAILSYPNIEKNLPIRLKDESIQKEEVITLEFYEDYEGFRYVLFENIVALNKKRYDKYVLFQKTQKLLDRIVFMCFAEDKGLLPANLIPTIIAEWDNALAEGREETLYDRFKAHFRFINRGFKSKKYNIYAYNGSLFAHDEVLDNLLIDDEKLQIRTLNLSRYDFDSDIDVNVLGHIFEHSLNQLEAKKIEIIENIEQEGAVEGLLAESNKRKLEGIFYTPSFITNYMVEETLGKLCDDKKKELLLDFTELNFEDENAKQAIVERIDTYEGWLAGWRTRTRPCLWFGCISEPSP